MKYLSFIVLLGLTALASSNTKAVNLPTTPADYTATGSLTSTGDVAVQVNGTSTVLISATGTGTGLTWSFQCYDGVNWISTSAYPISSGVIGSAVTTGSANGDWFINSAACAASSSTGIRVHLTAISGGTETFKLNASAGVGITPTVLVPGSALVGKIGIDQTTPGTTNGMSIAQIGATTVVNGGVAGSLAAGGPTASGSSVVANPLTVGGRAQNAEATAVTNGQVVNEALTLTGKLINFPYANPENLVNGTTSAITDTTSTSVIASAGGSLRNYITQCTVTNSHATVGTFVKILDGSTVIHEGYAGISGGGFAASFPVPLRGTAATAVNCQAVTTGANFICSCSGFTGI